MGIRFADLPPHIQKRVDKKQKQNGKKITDYAIESMKVKAVPHDHRMNKTERNYANHLQKMKMAGEIVDWKHEPFNLRLADRTFYKPDFVVVTTEGYIEVHEVKGRWQDDALVKIKTAAEMFPWFTFRAVFNEKGFWKSRFFNTKKGGFQYES